MANQTKLKIRKWLKSKKQYWSFWKQKPYRPYRTLVVSMKDLNPEKLRGLSPNHLTIKNRYGMVIDPDLGELNNLSPERILELWNEAKPKIDSFDLPIIYGTGGHSADEFRRMYEGDFRGTDGSIDRFFEMNPDWPGNPYYKKVEDDDTSGND